MYDKNVFSLRIYQPKFSFLICIYFDILGILSMFKIDCNHPWIISYRTFQTKFVLFIAADSTQSCTYLTFIVGFLLERTSSFFSTEFSFSAMIEAQNLVLVPVSMQAFSQNLIMRTQNIILSYIFYLENCHFL